LSWTSGRLENSKPPDNPPSRVKQFELSQNQVLLVKGPARLSFITGSGEVLGIKQGREPIIVRRGKILPVESLGGGVKVQVEGGEDMFCQVQEGTRIGSKIWRPAVLQIMTHLKGCHTCSIVLIGVTDSGKSTFATYLSNVLSTSGFKVTFVDADIGQNDLGPPGSIAVAHPTTLFTDLRDLSPYRMTYVGYISAGITFKPILDSLIRVLSAVKGEDQTSSVTIVNTDGFVLSKGLHYKLELLRLIKPHLTVTFGPTLYEIFSTLYEGQIIEAQLPEGIEKNHTDRLVRRMIQYNRFLASSRPTTIDLSHKRLKFLGFDFDEIVQITDLREVKKGKLNLMLSSEPIALIDHDISTAVISTGTLRDMFVGLGDEITVHGFGLVSKVYGTKLRLKTPTKDTFSTVYMGIIRLSGGNTEANAHLGFL
jgi:polynucleotide 5'-kinase involved in rRNA processing